MITFDPVEAFVSADVADCAINVNVLEFTVQHASVAAAEIYVEKSH